MNAALLGQTQVNAFAHQLKMNAALLALGRVRTHAHTTYARNLRECARAHTHTHTHTDTHTQLGTMLYCSSFSGLQISRDQFPTRREISPILISRDLVTRDLVTSLVIYVSFIQCGQNRVTSFKSA